MSHPLRPALVARLGERGFLGLYSLVALATFAWMIVAYRQGSDAGLLWVAPLLVVAVRLGADAVRQHPAGRLAGRQSGFPIRAPGAAAGPAPRGVFAITRHPMNWSFILWALVHASLSGSPRNLIVAGGILVLALFGSIGQDRKKERLLGEVWRDWEARTSFVPFAAAFAGKVRWRDAMPGADRPDRRHRPLGAGHLLPRAFGVAARRPAQPLELDPRHPGFVVARAGDGAGGLEVFEILRRSARRRRRRRCPRASRGA